MRGRPHNYGAEGGNTNEIGPPRWRWGVVGETRQAGEESPGPLSSLALITQALHPGQVLTQPLSICVNPGKLLNSLGFSFLIGRMGISISTHRSSRGFNTAVLTMFARVSDTPCRTITVAFSCSD